MPHEQSFQVTPWRVAGHPTPTADAPGMGLSALLHLRARWTSRSRFAAALVNPHRQLTAALVGPDRQLAVLTVIINIVRARGNI
jgi:hypothetical protein